MNGMTVLVSPLNWGFGHAGRMIPVAMELKRRGCEVIFAADASLLEMAARELPGIRQVEIPGLRIRYSRYLPQYICIFLQLPRIIASALVEHRTLRRLVREMNPSLIISDNRFGFYHRKVYSVYVTHQLRIPFPGLLRFMEPLAAWLHRMITGRYDLCLVPDFPGDGNLSGRLSHGVRLPRNIMYTGPLSRFDSVCECEDAAGVSGNPYVCLILSGPEPQRTLLLKKTADVMRGVRLVILGTGPAPYTLGETHPEVTYVTAPARETMCRIIASSSLIITRAGYTSVMELFSMGRGAVIIPTPGQTEQEYLGMHLNGKYGFLTLNQNQLDLLPEIVAGLADFADFAGNSSGRADFAYFAGNSSGRAGLTAGSPDLARPAAADTPELAHHTAAGSCADRSFAKALFEKAIDSLLEQNKK